MSTATSIVNKEHLAVETSAVGLADLLERQKAAYLKHPNPDFEERKANLLTLKKALTDNKAAFIQALDQDFGGRAQYESLLAEFMPSLEGIGYLIKHLKKWMRPNKRHVGIQLQPASAKVVYQPLGVVGIIVPFNYPLFLSVGPLMTALAAGNRAMIKMSEFTPATSELFAKVIAEAFPENQVTVVNGEADVAAEFTNLPFDHMLFTGSTPVGHHVMRAAANHLTPVTLELGGKSPVIVDRDFPLKESVERICYGKSLNAGQTCIAPDYILVMNDQKEAFIETYLKTFRKMYPFVNGNNDYTSIINERHHQRLLGLVSEATAKGATAHTPYDESITDGSRRIPIHLLTDVSDDMSVMQEEIFGPVLPVIGVDNLEEALSFIQNRPRPLALYYFGSDKETQERVINHTHSGGVCINECLFHVAVDDLPFGGIGPSGMGHYHGHEGFLTFSKPKAVLTKGKLNTAKMVYPPYKGWLQKKLMNFISGG
ncbi:coniferyl-aldehyde dehydrogenase [Endozoicomonas sp. (ex Bugula neritina AB1)]|nr:coniferyl-aldehyde dehydrogenase [Endozoicomonas sp. (ex Bugula neritina AB1)]